jgi:uncharacterized protein (TIGR02145 family)
MSNQRLFALLLILIVLIIRCGLSEPEKFTGSLRIQVVQEDDYAQLAKKMEQLSTVRCILKKGTQTVHDQDHSKTGDSFQINIDNLDPGTDYSVLLYGFDSGSEFLGRGFRDGISITAGNVTNVSVSLNQFKPTLSSPADGSTIADNILTFDWSDVNDAAAYELQVDNSSDFTNPEIHKTSLTSSTYTPTTALADGTWYWRVRYLDNQDIWGRWSSTWSFIVEVAIPGIVTDIDGNVYQTVKIGDQWWMAENLKVIHYRNGDPIPNVSDDTEWSNLTTGAYCNCNNDESHVATYGRLYNGYAVIDSRNIAPAGWHVPSDDEWKELEMYLGMSQSEADMLFEWRGTNEGGKLKQTGTTHWKSPNTGATNESGFSALPGSARDHNGDYWDLGYYAGFWSSTIDGYGYAWTRYLDNDHSEIYRHFGIVSGFSVRCVRD